MLLIHQTALNDEGEIKCTATNRAGHVSTKARLILEGQWIVEGDAISLWFENATHRRSY